MNEYNAIGWILGGLGLFTSFLIIFEVAIFLISAFGIKKVLKYYGHNNIWMAFIPIVSTIALVQCMNTDANGNVFIFGKAIEKKWFVWFPVLQLVVGFIPTVGFLLSTAIGIICLAHTYKDLLNRASDSKEDNTVLAWVSSIIGVVWIALCYVKFNGIPKTVEIVMEDQPQQEF